MDFSMFESTRQEMPSKVFPENTPLAMAYVPMQQWGKTYSVEKGFDKGTVFPELDLPFEPGEGCI